jgi:hypothetical protein
MVGLLKGSFSATRAVGTYYTIVRRLRQAATQLLQGCKQDPGKGTDLDKIGPAWQNSDMSNARYGLSS